MMGRRVQLCFVALLAITATSAEKCKPATCFSSNKSPLFSSNPGQQYTYAIESVATAQLVNKESIETSVSIKGNAIVTAKENCGFSLHLDGVTAFGADNSKIVIQKDVEMPVQFTFSGDELSPEICADAADGVFSLNIKRGVISALQNSVGRSTELDVFGKCPVTTSSSTSGGLTTVTSVRDLNECAYREKLSTGLMQGVFSESSEIKNSPILDGKIESDAKFQKGALKSIELKETYNFLPFSTQNHGAKGKVVTKMDLKSTAAGTSKDIKTPVLRTLLFENANSFMVNPKAKIFDSIKSAFHKTLQEFTAQEGILTAKAATSFADLVRLMRLAKKGDLSRAYNEMKKGTLSDLSKSSNMKSISRSVFLDALFRAGTGDSVAALADLAKKEFNEKELQLMYLSFNLVQSVNKDAITGLTKLFTENLPKEGYLSIGSVVNKFCRDRGCEPGDVKTIADKFIAKIPKDCKTTDKKDEDELVAVLKGIRNSQTILNSALDKIIQCANTKNPNRVRVAALQAFTANPCNKKLQTSATNLIKDRQEDSEVRIEAYLSAMDCPSGALANDIKALLDTEPINQVGTFINTHLDSIKASTDPKREHARIHFKNVRTLNKFPFDPRRYSFNREVSYAIDSLGLGSSVDTSVIYSQQSFLPRSLRMNMTGNLFGSSFNLLEVSARQENVEQVFEHYFGPRGYFTKMNSQELYDTIKKHYSEVPRHKRALPQDMHAFDKSVKLSSEYRRDPDIDLSIKVFGSELYFLSLSQNMPATPSDFLKLFASELNKGVDALKNFQYNFENHAIWMDFEVVYPTALGLPFKFTTTGASAVKVDVAGSIDVKQIIDDPVNSKVYLQFSPAANVFMSGQMGFSAYAYETSLEVTGTFYTNTGANTTIEVLGGTSIVVTTVPTVKNQYVIELSHQILKVTQEVGKEAVKTQFKPKVSESDTDLCFDQAEFITGFTLCAHVEYLPLNSTDNAMWPLQGNDNIQLKLEMVDAITFKAEFDNKEAGKPGLNFYYNTPKEGKERQLSLKLLTSLQPEHFMGGFDLSVPLDAQQPIKVHAGAGLVNKPNEKKIYLSGNYMETPFEYALGFSRKGNEIVPILKFQGDLKYIDGKILETQTKNGVKYTLNHVKFGQGSYLLTVDGSVEADGPKLISDLRFIQDGKNYNLQGTLGYTEGHFDTDFKLSSPQVASANGKLNYNLKYSDTLLGNDLIVVWDKDANSKKNRFELSQNADWATKDMYKTKNSILLGTYDLSGKFNGDFGKTILNIDSFVDYNNQKAELKIDNKYSQRQPHDYETSVYVAANQRSAKLEMKRDIEGDSSKITNKLELSSGIRAELNGKVGHKFDCHNADISVQGVFVPGQKKDQTKATIVLKNTEKGHQSNSKVTVGKREIASVETELTYGNVMDGKLKASLTDAITIDGTLKSTNGKGNTVITAGVKDRKLHAESQFTIQKPTYDFVTDIFYDYEKDNTKKIHIATNNKIENTAFVSKNDVEIFSERYSFNIAASQEGALPYGNIKIDTDFTLPTGRKFMMSGERDVKAAGDVVNGQAHFEATDELPNKQQRKVVLDMKVKDLNRRLGYFDHTTTLKYHGFDNKDFKVQSSLKNAKKDHFSAASGSIQIDGLLIPEPVTVTVSVDEYCANHAIFNGNAKYGTVGDVDVKGKFYVQTDDRPHSHDFTGILNIPKTSLKRVTVTSSGQLTEPATPEGNYVIKYSGSADVGGKKVQLDTDMKVSERKGSGSAKLHLPEIKPISGEVTYSHDGETKGDASLTVNYGDNKKVQTSLGVQVGEKIINVNAAMKGDFEIFKDISVQVNVKEPTENEIVSKSVLTLDGQQYSIDYEHRATAADPKFVLVVVRPQGTSKISAEAFLVSQVKGKGTIIIENIESFDFSAKLDGDLTAIETFYLNGEVHSPLLGVKQFVFDIKAKDVGSGKTGVEFKATAEGKHLISGSTDFTTKTDKNKTIIEGKSTVKLGEGKGDDVTFKLVRNMYDRQRDGEYGFGGSLGINVGPRKYDSELKVTDKEFNVKYTGCEGKSNCHKLLLRSALQKPTMEGFNHVFNFIVDMRPVGVAHEFGINSETSRDGFKFRHSFDTYLKSKDKPDYMYSFFVDPKQFQAHLDIPSRQVALEGSYKYPEKSPFGIYDGTVTFYLDKTHKPQQKTEVSYNSELKQNKGLVTGKGNIYFEHPKMKKLRVGGEFQTNAESMNVNSKLELDVFNSPNDMVVFTVKFENHDQSGIGFNVTNEFELYSKGLGFNAKYHGHDGISYEKRLITSGSELILPVKDFKFGYDLHLNEVSTDFVVTAFAQPIVTSNVKYDTEKYDVEVDSKVQWPGSAIVPLVQKSTVTGLKKGTFTLNKGKQFAVESGYELGKEIHLTVQGGEKEVFNGKISLDANHFMKSNYHVDEAQLKDFGIQLKDQFKKDFSTAEKDVKDKIIKSQKFMNDKLEKIIKSAPDFAALQKETQEEFAKFVEELKKDEEIKKLLDQFVIVVEEISRMFETFTSYLKQQYETIDLAVREFYTQIVTAFNEKIFPEIEKLYEAVKELLSRIYEQTAKILTASFERIVKAMKSFEEDFNKISKAINEATASTYEAISGYMSELIKELKELCESFKTQLQNLPGIDVLKQKYTELLGEFHPIETLKAIIKEIFETIGSMLPEKAEPLFQKISDYIDKKMADEKVDDLVALKEIFKLLLETLQGFKKEYLDGFSFGVVPTGFNYDMFKRIPPFLSNVRFSALNQLTSEPIVNIRDLVYLYRPYAFNPIELAPPFKLHADVSDGAHIFTYDGRHLTFPGKCSYILSRDFVDGNFSIVATMDNGKLKSISLADKGGFLEVTKDGLLTSNDKKTEFPFHHGTMAAWRMDHTINIMTLYGAHIECSVDLVTCHFTVSGFYSGKLRGLLGNGNNEKYDDYLLPNGKVTESTSELGNAYRTKSSCEAIATSGDNHPKSHKNQYCTQYFGHDSPMRLCYIFVNPSNYREACEHATHGAADDKQSACAIASTYASRCRQEFIPVDIPKTCTSCTVGDRTVDVGDEVSVKVPQKQVDIVVAFDMKLNKQIALVQDVVTELKNELKKQTIDDIHVFAIGFNADDKYLYRFTTNGKLEFTGDFTKLKVNGPKEEAPLKTGNADADSVFETLEAKNREAALDLGLSPDARAFRASIDYPFRATASKVVLAFRSDGIPYSLNPGKFVMSEAVAKLVFQRGIYLAAFLPIKITEPADRAKNIVGFSNTVAVLINEKKRPNMGSVEVAGKLKYESDMGADVTRKYGFVFNSNGYAESDKKKYVGIAAYTLADIISRTEVISDCRCTLKQGLYPVTKCHATEQKLLSPKKA